ncbi:Ribosomal RNA processing protein 36 [Tetrabaena socialis]|uniref:rRNA biogenesis protein RRP36 n=1 Tax=Tetrabaena socialis TaxID=47790 RepID=A0A2J8AE77_9CHLO|nr:Ribosomal RNA processing protein 36 [Tetrabaena socialis]|eukprot:PNH10830.1 Ribosomal RNA processing protein 36 [Tetrabaena socialis]
MDADQLRALKRFKACKESDDDEDGGSEDGGEDDGADDSDSDSEEEGDGAGGAPRARPQGGVAGKNGAGNVRARSESEDDDTGPSGGADDDDRDERTLEEQVADVPFEVLEQLRRDGSGLVGQAARAAAARASGHSFKRQNKDRPQEVSSKRPVGRHREVIQVPHRRAVDAHQQPCTAPSSQRALNTKEKNPKFKARLQAQLQRVDTTLRDEDLRRRTQALETEWKSKERGAISAGKTPFYLKASDKKRLELLAKYQELKERGKLDKFMEKRRKKNASKDHRYLPSGRRQVDE